MRSLREELNAALRKGIYGENLTHIIRLSMDAAGDRPVSNPIAFYAIEAVFSDVYHRWFAKEPSTVETSEELERRIVPAALRVLDASDVGGPSLLASLNDLVTSYLECTEAVRRDIDALR
jgi:hypothetical protein